MICSRDNSAPITVALVSHSPYLAGAERMLLNLARLLRRTPSVEPILLIPGYDELSEAAAKEGLLFDLIAGGAWYLWAEQDLPGYKRKTLEAAESVKRAVVDWNADCLVINTLTNIAPAIAAVELDLPSLAWVHGILDSYLLPDRSSEICTVHDQMLLQVAREVVACSPGTSRFFEDMLGCGKLHVIENWTPIDPAWKASPQKYRSRRFACLNTMEPHKGYGPLLEAAAILKQRGVSFQLDIYGDGPLREALRDRIAATGLRAHVFLHGRTTEVTEVYDRSLCLINPSYVEPFGMTLIEAMARGTPVIATKSGGPCGIVVHGKNGFLLNRGDAIGLADRMQQLLGSAELARFLGENAYRTAQERYSEDAARGPFVRLIRETVARFSDYDLSTKTLIQLYRLFLRTESVSPRDIAAGGERGSLRRAVKRRIPAPLRKPLGRFRALGNHLAKASACRFRSAQFWKWWHAPGAAAKE